MQGEQQAKGAGAHRYFPQQAESGEGYRVGPHKANRRPEGRRLRRCACRPRIAADSWPGLTAYFFMASLAGLGSGGLVRGLVGGPWLAVPWFACLGSRCPGSPALVRGLVRGLAGCLVGGLGSQAWFAAWLAMPWPRWRCLVRRPWFGRPGSSGLAWPGWRCPGSPALVREAWLRPGRRGLVGGPGSPALVGGLASPAWLACLGSPSLIGGALVRRALVRRPGWRCLGSAAWFAVPWFAALVGRAWLASLVRRALVRRGLVGRALVGGPWFDEAWLASPR